MSKSTQEADGDRQTGSTSPDAAHVMRAGKRSVENWLSANQELTRFVSARLRKDIATVNAYAACKSTREVAEVWRKATQTAFHDYAVEFDKLAEIHMRR